MKTFRLKSSDIQAVQVDAAWKMFLQNEKGIQADISDYYYIDIAGNEQIMAKENFERLFSSL